MPKEPLGITFIIPAGQEATGVYEVEGGIEVFETDTPYLLSDGVSLQTPLPVFDAGGPVFQDSMGNVQAALGVSGLGPVDAPENTVAPVVSGTAQVGETLTTTNGTWTGNPSPTYSYQWQRNTGTWDNITGATASTYELVEADETFTIRCVVTATNSGGSASANSNATDAVAAAPDATAPTLSNPTGDATGDLSVDTDEGNGTLYWYVSTSATPPSAADLKAGDGAADYGSQAVIATGDQTASTSGLVTETTYYAHFLHRDAAGNESAIVTSAGFAVESSPAQHVIIAVMAGQSNLNGRNDPDGLNVNRANKFALDADSQRGSYLTLLSDTTALHHPEHLDRTGPDDQILDDLAVANPAAIVIGVPCCSGGIGFTVEDTGFFPGPDAESSGPNFNDIITLTTTAVTLAQAAYPGCTIEPIMFLQIGEAESNGTSRATVAAKAADYVTYARSRLAAATGVTAFEAMPVSLGMTLSTWWHPSSANPGANARAVIAGFVDASLAVSGLSLVAADVPCPASDNLHYQPAEKAREQGAAHLPGLTRTDHPTITTLAAQGSFVGNTITIPITHDKQLDANYLCTAHIVGGDDAASFEIDDPYGASNFYAPKLRWVGNGTGPVSEGDYEVEVALRNSAGVMGTPKAITVTVAEPAAVEIDVTHTYSAPNVTSAFGAFSLTDVPVKAGLNLFYFLAPTGTNQNATFAMTVDGNPITKLLGSATGVNQQMWSYVSAIDTTVTLAGTWGGGGTLTFFLTGVSVAGVDPTPVDSDLLLWTAAATGTYFATNSITCPTDGIIVAISNHNNSPVVVSPTVEVANTTSGRIWTRDSTGPLEWTNTNGSLRGVAAVSFAPA